MSIDHRRTFIRGVSADSRLEIEVCQSEWVFRSLLAKDENADGSNHEKQRHGDRDDRAGAAGWRTGCTGAAGCGQKWLRAHCVWCKLDYYLLQ